MTVKEHNESPRAVEFQWASVSVQKTLKMGIVPPTWIRFQVGGPETRKQGIQAESTDYSGLLRRAHCAYSES